MSFAVQDDRFRQTQSFGAVERGKVNWSHLKLERQKELGKEDGKRWIRRERKFQVETFDSVNFRFRIFEFELLTC